MGYSGGIGIRVSYTQLRLLLLLLLFLLLRFYSLSTTLFSVFFFTPVTHDHIVFLPKFRRSSHGAHACIGQAYYDDDDDDNTLQAYDKLCYILYYMECSSIIWIQTSLRQTYIRSSTSLQYQLLLKSHVIIHLHYTGTHCTRILYRRDLSIFFYFHTVTVVENTLYL